MASTQQITPVGRRNRRIERDSWVPTLGPGMVLGAIGTIGLVVSMFMSWRTPDVHPSGIPFAFLFDRRHDGAGPVDPARADPDGDPARGRDRDAPRSAARIVGALGTIAVVVLFVIQLNSQLDAIPGANVGDVLDTGFYIAAIAGLVGLVSGFLPSGWAQRRWTQTESVDDRRGVNFDDPHV